MLGLSCIKQSIEQANYGCSKHTLLLFVPAVSLIVQKIQVSHVISILKQTYQQPSELQALLESREYRKLNTVFGWHTLGSLIQIVALVALSRLNPLFLIPAAISMYELYSSAKGLCHRVIYVDGGLHINT